MWSTDIYEKRERALEIPIENVIEKYVHLQSNGRHLAGLCPFHDDQKVGSFLVTPAKQIWKCFSCNVGGNAIDFVMEYKKVPFNKAVKEILSEPDFENIPKRPVVSKQNGKRNVILYHKVYTELLAMFPLTVKQKEYLCYERGVPEQELHNFGYLPQDALARYHIAQKLYKKYGDKILEVPGFYVNEKENVMLNGTKGFILAVRNVLNYIVGMQIRRENIGNGEFARYIWLSSVNKDGCSPGSPVHVYRPSTWRTNTVLITEGIFKAIVAAEHFGCRAISLQGMGNWRGYLIDTLINLGADEVILAVDADIWVKKSKPNKHIKPSLREMNKKIRKFAKIRTIRWSAENGKGIDDVIISKKQDNFRYYPSWWQAII